MAQPTQPLILPRLADGALGTQLIEQGLDPSSCLEALNLTHAALIQAIHADYIQAGAGLILTHTFGANRWRLTRQHREHELSAINQAAVANVRAVATHGILIAGNIGPSGLSAEEIKHASLETLIQGYAEQANILTQAGVNVLVLETFTQRFELLAATQAALTSNLPVIAGFTPLDARCLPDRTPLVELLEDLQSLGSLAGIGINCCDPSTLAAVIGAIKPLTRLPILAKPNAGLPESTDKGLVYPIDTDAFVRRSQKLFDLGAACVGGCCGTTPKMIKMLRMTHQP